MALKQSKQVVAGYPSPTPRAAADLIHVTGEYTVVAADAIGDIVEMGAIPEGCIPLDVIVNNGALGASATLDVGILSGEYAKADGARTMGNEFIASGAAATSGVLRMTKNPNAVLPSDELRGWGVKFLVTDPAAGQVVRATLVCVPAPVGM
jgi:hypothetical protein